MQSPPVQPPVQPLPEPPPSPAPTRLPWLSRLSWQRAGLFGAGLIGLALVLFLILRSGPSEQQAAHDRLANTATDEPSPAQQVIAASTAPTPLSTPRKLPAPPATPPSTLSSASLTLPTPSTEPVPATPTVAANVVPTEEASPPDTPVRESLEASALEPTPLVLRVQAVEETWMRLDIDDGTRQEALIQAGQSREWKANEQFSLIIGNVKGARVLLNEQELDLPETRSNVLRDYVLTRALLNPRRTD